MSEIIEIENLNIRASSLANSLLGSFASADVVTLKFNSESLAEKFTSDNMFESRLVNMAHAPDYCSADAVVSILRRRGYRNAWYRESDYGEVEFYLEASQNVGR
jgi:hypothetical protein